MKIDNFREFGGYIFLFIIEYAFAGHTHASQLDVQRK